MANNQSEEKISAVYEIQYCLREWGVDPSRNQQHQSFYRSIVASVEDCYATDEEKQGASQLQKSNEVTNEHVTSLLPKDDPVQAIEMVLKAHLQDTGPDSCIDITDRQEMEYEPPYQIDRRGSNFVSRKKWAFRNLSQEELDPFQRFSVTRRYEKMEYFYKTWMEKQLRNDNIIRRRVFQALVTVHAIHYEKKCPHCQQSECLRWSGSCGSPVWGDMVCTSCQSVFEIKTKSDVETIEGARTIPKVPGGSFVGYHRLCHQRQQRKEGWKHFVAVVNTKPSYESIQGSPATTKHLCWVVELAEIERVCPRLGCTAFCNNSGGQPSALVASKIIVAATPWKGWFKIPIVEVQYKPILAKLLADEFPSHITIDEHGDCKLRIKDEQTKTKHKKAPRDLARIREKLHRLSISKWLVDSSDDEKD